MKVIVIGSTHAGTAFVTKAAELYPDFNITMYEKNDTVSFLSCGIALYVEGVINNTDGLFYSSPEALSSMGVNVKMKHEVLSIDVKKKTISVKNLETNEEFQDDYDKLVIATGSWPIYANIDGIKLDNILLCKNFEHANKIMEKSRNVKNVTIVGAGYIGIELVEAFEKQGKNVTVIDIADTILPKYLDREFINRVVKQYEGKNITIALNQKVEGFKGKDNKVTSVVTDKGEHESDLVIMCVGFRPCTDLFIGQIDMYENGAIITDQYMRTSDPDVLAAGDCCGVFHNPTGIRRYIPLATNAVRMGTLAAINLMENRVKQIGTQSTSGIKIYNENIAATGLTEEIAKDFFPDVKSVTLTAPFRPAFMPTAPEVTLKLTYRTSTREVLGGQLISTYDYTQTINTISVCIQNKMTIDELAFVDQFFQPHFNTPWNIINATALKAISD